MTRTLDARDASRTVLFIDDERVVTGYYMKEIEEYGFRTIQAGGPDEALACLLADGTIIAVVLDVMMPHGDRYSPEETEGGMRTGVLLYSELQRLRPGLPVVVLTNVILEGTLDQFGKACWLRIVQKDECPPSDLTRLLLELLKTSAPKRQEREDHELGRH